jgi:predicted permease
MRFDDDMEEELRSHVAHRADDLERSGLTRAEAERRARIELGARERIKDEIREAAGRTFVETLVQDARFSVRVLRKSPGFTLVAVVTLALAIGANAVVFGVLNRLLIRPLDVPRAESLYGIEHGNEHDMALSYPDYRDLRDRNRSFDGLAAYTFEQVGLDTGERSTRAWIVAASGNYFDVLGIQPHLGRVFHASDERGPNSAPYIVLGYAYWHTRFQNDPGIIGRVVRLNKHPFTIVGVAPPGFHGTLAFFSPDLYVPMVDYEPFDVANRLEARGSRWVFMTLGHLKPGVTTDRATADLNSIGAYLDKTYPKEHGGTTFVLARPGFYGSYLGQPLKAFVFGLMVLAGLILLAACANLGSLFAARAADHSREVALRLALGASRARILRQLLTEAVILALAGGALGLWAGVALLQALTTWHPFPKYPINVPVSPDATVYVMALVVALVSGLLSGIVPVRQVFRTDPYQIIKAGPGTVVGRRITLRDLLLLGQIAVCAVLITASMVAVRGLARSLHTSYGFEPRNTLLVDTDLTMAAYNGDQVPPMQRRMIDAVQAIPGVAAVAIGRPPLTEDTGLVPIFTDGAADLRVSNAAARAARFQVSPEYFEAAGTALILGRAFSWHDDRSAPPVAVVNSALAAKLFGSAAHAPGRHFKLRDGARLEVVGVAEDGKYADLAEDPRPAMFLPILQSPTADTWLVVRSTGDPEQVAAAVRTTLRGLDAGLPLYVQTWTRQLDFARFPSRMATAALGIMGGMGAVLAISGIFGMAAYSVSRRMRELGIRIALGAQRRELLQAALGRAVKLLGIGSAAGVILGVLASRVLASIVFHATPRDPVVLAGVVLAMLSLGLLATWIPARRALSIDPLILLREE